MCHHTQFVALVTISLCIVCYIENNVITAQVSTVDIEMTHIFHNQHFFLKNLVCLLVTGFELKLVILKLNLTHLIRSSFCQ